VLSQTAEYALRAVLYIATQPSDQFVRVPRLAAATGVPRNYLSKTLHQLTHAGVLCSARGPAGGFRLAGPAADITLQRVVAPFTGTDTRRCLLHDRACGSATACEAHARWEPVAREVRRFFGATTVADLVAGAPAERAERAPAPLLNPHHSAAGGDTL
jgi:Rrf2 family protein